MKNEYIAEVTIKRNNGQFLEKEDSFTMPVEMACTYIFFKYGAKGTLATKLLGQFAFEWEKANQEMDELIEKKRKNREAKK